MKKDKLIEKAVKWAKSKGFSDIRANIEGYEMPNQFQRQSDNSVFIPDLTANSSNRKNYLEIVMKSDDDSDNISKLTLLSSMANVKDGKLILLAPNGHMRYTKDIAEQYNLNAEVISLR